MRILLWGTSILLGIFIALAIGVGLFFDVNRYKPQIEAAVAKSTGMNLKIRGKAALRIFPHARIALRDVHLSNRGSELFTASELQVSPRLMPFLLHREMIVDKVSIVSPRIRIERSAQGRLNYETARSKRTAPQKTAAGQVHSVSIRNADLDYLDRGTGRKIELRDVNADLSGIAWPASRAGPQSAIELMKSVTVHGGFQAQSLRSDKLVFSNLKAVIRDDHGMLRLDPTEVNLFGGKIRGNAQIDLRGAVPKLKITQSASQIDLSQAPMTGRARGFADASLNLAASGKDPKSIVRTTNGTVSIHSENITLFGIDVDDLAAKLRTAQGMDLVNLGSALISGPFAPALGQAAGIAGGAAETESKIRRLVSDWKITNGVAKAKDVAFATAKTTIAFQGDLNLAQGTYQNFYVATVDPKGCAKNKVEVGGTLRRPHPVAGSIGRQLSQSYLGSAESAIAGLFGPKGQPPKAPAPAPAGCDHFYSGSAINVG